MREAEGRARRRLAGRARPPLVPRGAGRRRAHHRGEQRPGRGGGAGPGAALAVGPRLRREQLDLDRRPASAPSGSLPRMKEKIAAHYPGTRLAITEYNYGGGEHVSGGGRPGGRARHLRPRGRLRRGALGPAGRRRATWTARSPLYCNYDGAGGRFGDTSIGAATSNHETTSVYASVDAGPRRPHGARRRQQVHGADHGRDPGHPPRGFRPRPDLADRRQLGVARSAGPTSRPSARNAFRLEMPASSVTTVVLTR